jgi:hypothetical protein
VAPEAPPLPPPVPVWELPPEPLPEPPWALFPPEPPCPLVPPELPVDEPPDEFEHAPSTAIAATRKMSRVCRIEEMNSRISRE